ncbi:MAG: cytochrome c family protein [Rhizobiales bacterium]|nr:cytochrome c family protein [Hyphomicrobiales bacterium]
MKSLLLALAFTGAASFAHAQDAASGEKIFNQCRACHRIGPDAKNAVGPVLNGVVGRKAGTYGGYAYSDAMKASGQDWTEENLTAFLQKPKAAVPGTKMAFIGLKDPTKVADLIAYLKTFDAAGQKTQ